MQNAILRVARPTDNLPSITQMYVDGLDFERLSSFSDHDGFDGEVIGHRGSRYHLEFTHHRGSRVGKAPTEDHLLVFYIPGQADWADRCQRMLEAGFRRVASYNPYWDVAGETFEDIDGYRVVIQCSEWQK